MNDLMIDNVCYYKDYFYGVLRYYVQPYIYKYSYFDISKINDNIYISDLISSMNLEKLKEEGITDILGTLLGVYPIYPEIFKYKNIHTRDIVDEDIEQYFEECTKYIDEVVKNNGKILVHCSYGISRSATIVIAYFIKYHRMTYKDAYELVKSKRNIIEPNDGFKIQLIKFEEKHKI